MSSSGGCGCSQPKMEVSPEEVKAALTSHQQEDFRFYPASGQECIPLSDCREIEPLRQWRCRKKGLFESKRSPDLPHYRQARWKYRLECVRKNGSICVVTRCSEWKDAKHPEFGPCCKEPDEGPTCQGNDPLCAIPLCTPWVTPIDD